MNSASTISFIKKTLTPLGLLVEIILGLLALSVLLLGGALWWFNQPENNHAITDWVQSHIDARLTGDEQFHFRTLSTELSTQPWGAKIVLDDTRFEHPEIQVLTRKVHLIFAFDDLLVADFTPHHVRLDQSQVFNKQSADQISSQTTRDFSDIAAGLLLALIPENLPENPLSSLFDEIDGIAINDLDLVWHQGETMYRFSGNADLSSHPERTIRLEGEYSESQQQSTSHIDALLYREGKKLHFHTLHQVSSALLRYFPQFEGGAKWLDTLGTDGTLKLDGTLDLDAWDRVTQTITSTENAENATIAFAIADAVSAQGNLLWPAKNTAFVLDFQKQTAQEMLIELQGKREFSPPALTPAFAQLPPVTEMTLSGTIDAALQNFHLNPSRIVFAEKGDFQLSAEYNRETARGSMKISGENVDFTAFPVQFLLPDQIDLLQGQAKKISATWVFDHQGIDISTAQATVHNLHLGVSDNVLKIPEVHAQLDDPKTISLIAHQGLKYLGFSLDQVTLEGNPQSKLHGNARLTLDPTLISLALEAANVGHLPLLQDLNVQNVTAETRFALDIQKLQLDLKKITLAQPSHLQLQGIPLTLENFSYHHTSPRQLQASGSWQNAPFEISVEEKKRALHFHANIHEFPLPSIALGAFDGHGTLSAQATGVYQDTLEELAIKVDLDQASISQANFGEISTINDQAHLAINLLRKGNLWKIACLGQLYQSHLSVHWDYDYTNDLVTQISDSHFTRNDEKTTFRGLRNDQGLSLRFDSQRFSGGEKLIKFLKSPATDLPHAITPLKTLDWNIAERISNQQFHLGKGRMTVTFATRDDEGHLHRKPSLGILQELVFDFVEPNPAKIYRKNGSSQPSDPHLGDEVFTEHHLHYIPGKSLRLQSPNVGKILRFFDLSRSLSGGIAQMELKPANNHLKGKLTINNFRIHSNNGAIKFLEAISVIGLIPLLGGEGVPFYALSTNVEGERFQWALQDLKTFGPGLSIAFNGNLDIDQETVNGEGASSPTSVINAVLSNIPLIGSLLTGTDGGGLIAVNFDISGPVQNPVITTSPLSLLTPGALRNIFGELGESLNFQKN